MKTHKQLNDEFYRLGEFHKSESKKAKELVGKRGFDEVYNTIQKISYARAGLLFAMNGNKIIF